MQYDFVIGDSYFWYLFLEENEKIVMLMKSESKSTQFIFLLTTLCAFSAECADSINLGYGGLNPMPHCHATVYNIEYEHQLNQNTSILGRGSRVDYKDDDEIELEEGKLKGLDIGARYYSAGDLHGVFWGGSLGYWTDHWTSIGEKNRTDEWQNTARSKSLRVNADVGYRFPILETNISITPQVNFGKFFSSYTCEYTSPPSRISTPCSESSVVNYYLFVGAALGITF